MCWNNHGPHTDTFGTIWLLHREVVINKFERRAFTARKFRVPSDSVRSSRIISSVAAASGFQDCRQHVPRLPTACSIPHFQGSLRWSPIISATVVLQVLPIRYAVKLMAYRIEIWGHCPVVSHDFRNTSCDSQLYLRHHVIMTLSYRNDSGASEASKGILTSVLLVWSSNTQ